LASITVDTQRVRGPRRARDPAPGLPGNRLRDPFGGTFRLSAAVSAGANTIVSVRSTDATAISCAKVSDPRRSAKAMLASAAARSASQAIMVCFRSQRSTSAPAGSWKRTYGIQLAKRAMPALAAEPLKREHEQRIGDPRRL
jgi:hypothetical protein